MAVAPLTTEQTYDLRGRVLRAGMPPEASQFPHDSQSRHWGWVVGGRILSVVTAHPEASPLFDAASQWRIRGMATEPAHQGEGLGGKVLVEVLAWAKRERIFLWCNARVKAIPFYERHGFATVGELFDIPTAGLHKVMWVQP